MVCSLNTLATMEVVAPVSRVHTKFDC